MHNFLIIPSIDIQDGKTVRVVQGIPELNCKEYGNNPVDMAMIWRTENAKMIHVVDFDAATDHSHKNFDVIREICESVVIPVQYGGGVRSFEDAKELMDLGICRLVIGTLAFENPKEFVKILENFGPSKIVAAIDVVDDSVAIRGRKSVQKINADNYAVKLKDLGAERIIVTDVKTNGMMLGPNCNLSNRIADSTGLKVTLSGGISGYKDLIKVKEDTVNHVDSVIIGRALYENKFPCQKIWRVAESGIFN
ncbi:MAG: 1-(5-phosphoribosyl)-5-[(5-phosphoribosylamino)methylideneamino]imidazole-4-carboxamide isomerase [Melioribacteraceae bacterium]|nr:1-(5-phosphoribosyl)-5-[(5-phosphoribosylamino)methylideneamino]imidazole-4-carboxamide isomerase [Ignavibacteriota bacterium]MBZ0182405.1 1-(5-phosphoribosyl)-5-[(5-phosphoribosylamino)methylideneamino]imidazole-4-carboxamide isomerase [Melioribacteraceae bacterium]